VETEIIMLMGGGTAVAGVVVWAYRTFVSYREFNKYTDQAQERHAELVGIITEALTKR
jgi:hypothetical protein